MGAAMIKAAAAPLRHIKPYPAYKDSGVEWLGQIPEHWSSLALSRVTISKCDGPFGSGLKSDHYSWDGVRVIRLQNIGSTEFLDHDRAFIDETYARELGDHSVIADDILIAGLGDEGHPVGRGCVAPHGIEPAMVKADCFRFRIDRRRVVPRFAAYQLSATALAAAGSLATGATRARMNLGAMASRKVALPSLEEQRAIAAFLDHETTRINALVEKKERLIELLQEERTAIVTRAVTKGLAPNVPMKESGIEWLEQIPAHWEVRRLRHVSPSLGVGVVVNPSNYVSNEGLPFLYGSDISEGRIHAEESRRISQENSRSLPKSQLRPGDLVMVRVGAPGVTAVVPPELDGANCASLLVIRRSPDVVSPWLCYVLNSRYVRSQIEVVQYGAAQEQFNVSHAVDFVIAVPPFREQQDLAVFLDRETSRIHALIDKISDAIDRLMELRIALISAAVTGKIDVRERVA